MVKMSITVPDEVGEYLRGQRNSSAVVAEAVQARMKAEGVERARRQAASRAYAEWYRRQLENDPEFAADMAALEAHQNEMLARDAQW